MKQWDALVVGAGPSGSVAATLLARAGWRVGLVDRADDGRLRIGETLPAAAVRLLRRLGLPSLDRDGSHQPIRGTISAWGGPPVLQDAVFEPEGPSWRLDRPAFDRALRQTAIKNGSTHLVDWIRRVERREGQWRLETKRGGFLESSIVIDATGRRSLLARASGVRRRFDAPLVSLWAVGEAPSEMSDRTLIEATATGWWYAARLPDGRALVAYHTAPQPATRLTRSSAIWRRQLAETRLIAAHIDPKLFRGCCVHAADARGAWLDRVTGDDWIACGDAAVSFDPVASQGLLNALTTGEAVARALLADDRGAALIRYEDNIREVRRIYALRRQAVYARVETVLKTSFWTPSEGGLPVCGSWQRI